MTNNINSKFNWWSFVIKTSDNDIKDFSVKHQNIKVFNKEFIEENVFWENWANYIIYLGKDTVEQKEIIEELNKWKEKIVDLIKKINKEILDIEKEKDTLLTDQARIIRETIWITFTATHIKQYLTPFNEDLCTLTKEDLKIASNE